MSGNRSKYTSIPTYGMQKRGIAQKLGFGRPQMNQQPDFSQGAYSQPAPYGNTGYGGPVQGAPQTPSYLNNPAVQPAGEMQNPGMVPQGTNPYGGIVQPQTNSFGYAQSTAPQNSTLQQGYQYDPRLYPQSSGNPYSVNAQAPQQTQQFTPLSNRAPAMNTMGSGLRAQGYVPPQGGFIPTQKTQPDFRTGAYSPVQPNNPYQQPQAVNPPAQQPYPQQQQPWQGTPMQQRIPVQSIPQPNPQQNQPQNNSAQGFSEALAAHRPPKQKKQKNLTPGADPGVQIQKPDGNRMIALLLFGILPLVFLVSVFQTPIFYAFIGMTLLGLSVLWYRDLYSQMLRLIISAVFVGMCIFGIVRLMSESGPRTINAAQANPTPQIITVMVTPEPGYYSADQSDLLETQGTLQVTPEPVTEISEAERRLSAFMELWKVNNASSMVSYVQPSWAAKQTDSAQALFYILANRTVEDYKIEEVGGNDSDTSRSVTMTATINKNNGKSPSIFRFTIMMVKEGEDWYVNPNSLASNDEVATKTDDVVVNDSNSKGKATEPPRTTVTPAPPASTLLYYNPSGGSKYHIDPNCSSVANEYLPLQGSFTYRELASYKSSPMNLSPCLKCGAPTDTLPNE